MIKTAFVTFLSLCAFAPGAAAQIAGLTPLEPRAGEVLTITYNPKATGAKLTLDEDVYAIGQTYFPERKPVVFKMRKVGEVYQHEFVVPADLSYISFNFRSVNALDTEVKVETLIYRVDGAPVRNAYLSKLISRRLQHSDDRELLEHELALYPDNYAAYVYKWPYNPYQPYTLLGASPSIESVLNVTDDWDVIEGLADPHTIEYQYAKAMSSIEMRNRDEFMTVLKQMLNENSDSPLTWTMLKLFLDRARVERETNDEVKALERRYWELLRRYPDSQMARDGLQSFAWSDDFFNPKNEFPLESLEQIGAQWIAAEPDNPFPHTYLARIYHDRRQKSERALAMVEHALSLYEAGKHRLYMNSGKIYGTESLLANNFLVSAELHFRLQKLTEAFARVKAARMHYQERLFKKTEFETYLLEARILRAQGNLIAAEGSYLTAWMNGYDEAEAELKEVYQKRKGTLDGFTAYLRGRRDVFAGKEAAPAFNATSLDGQKLDLAALKGKVVVLNFWHIACLPCQAEMPGLNSLVSEFKDKEVVFIALATDHEKKLRKLLKTKVFNYQIIPDAETICQKYNINLWPTHIILNRDGNLAQRITGGINRHEELRRLINRTLY
jgi:peroxiredoxin